MTTPRADRGDFAERKELHRLREEFIV